MSVANSEEGAGDADEIVVYNAYLLCLGSFSSCRTCPHLSKASQQGVEEEAGRFDVWAINTGSCLDPSFSSSLDHSLRNSHSTREMVVLLLRAIRVNLDYGTCNSVSLKRIIEFNAHKSQRVASLISPARLYTKLGSLPTPTKADLPGNAFLPRERSRRASQTRHC